MQNKHYVTQRDWNEFSTTRGSPLHDHQGNIFRLLEDKIGAPRPHNKSKTKKNRLKHGNHRNQISPHRYHPRQFLIVDQQNCHHKKMPSDTHPCVAVPQQQHLSKTNILLYCRLGQKQHRLKTSTTYENRFPNQETQQMPNNNVSPLSKNATAVERKTHWMTKELFMASASRPKCKLSQRKRKRRRRCRVRKSWLFHHR